MTTLTSTSRTETRVAVTRCGAGQRVRVDLDARCDDGFPSIRPMLLASDTDSARISLVPEGALLLDGDAVSLHVSVGAGTTLTLIEPAGTVAYDMRGGCATWDVSIDLAAGARLVWHSEPFVASAGSRTTWTTRITLGEGARLSLRETVVLGRHGEVPGSLRHEVHARREDGTPVFADGLDVGPATSSVLLGGNRVINSLFVIGEDAPASAGTRFELEDGGVLLRAMAREVHQLR
ncbi:MAG TPA: urease accessory protein UreD [Jatrophihabitans sp.]|jgi:urease accessory protein